MDLQGQLVQLEAELVRKYQVAAGKVSGLDEIQAQLHPEAALVGWLDLKTLPQAADPKGDHWACVVRRRAAHRVWVRIEGTGPDRAWTQADDDRPGQLRQLLSEGSAAAWQKPLAALAEQQLGPLEAALVAHNDLRLLSGT